MTELSDLIVEMREEEALKLARSMLADGSKPMDVLAEARDAMDILGERFACGEAFIPELILGGEIMSGISQELKPYVVSEGTNEDHGLIAIGTVAGDIHDIGKDIVVTMLEAHGHKVHDLGIDVSPQAFVDAIRNLQPQVLGLSGMLTAAFDSMKAVVTAVCDAGLRDQVKIMIGGAPVDALVCEYAGADGWGDNVGAALSLAEEWTGRQEA